MPSSPPARIDLLVAVAALAVVTGGPQTVGAQEAEADPVSLGAELQVFVPEAGDSLQEWREAMYRGLREQWSAPGDRSFRVVGRDSLQETVVEDPLYERTLDLARQSGEMGIDAYKRVETDQAVEYLERSLNSYEEIHHDFVDPREVSEIQMYLALSYLEDGTDVVRPLDVLRNMIRLDPSRRLESGYYPDFIVQYYENARQSLWNGLLNEGPSGEESGRLAELIGADYVFHGYAIPGSDDRVELVAHLYDAEADQITERERLTLETVEGGRLQEGIGRLASRLATRLTEEERRRSEGPDELAASTGTHPLSVELGGVYGSFLQVPSPVDDPFGNYGLGLGASWSVTREFQIVADLEVYNSMRDYSGVLREDFTTIRGRIGGELGRDFGPLYLGLATGLEAARIGAIRAFSDRTCIPDPDRLCPGETGTEVFDDNPLHWGLHVSPRLDWPLSDSFKLSSSVGLGYYFSPLEDRLLNFPVTTEMGIRYRF